MKCSAEKCKNMFPRDILLQIFELAATSPATYRAVMLTCREWCRYMRYYGWIVRGSTMSRTASNSPSAIRYALTHGLEDTVSQPIDKLIRGYLGQIIHKGALLDDIPIGISYTSCYLNGLALTILESKGVRIKFLSTEARIDCMMKSQNLLCIYQNIDTAISVVDIVVHSTLTEGRSFPEFAFTDDEVLEYWVTNNQLHPRLDRLPDGVKSRITACLSGQQSNPVGFPKGGPKAFIAMKLAGRSTEGVKWRPLVYEDVLDKREIDLLIKWDYKNILDVCCWPGFECSQQIKRIILLIAFAGGITQRCLAALSENELTEMCKILEALMLGSNGSIWRHKCRLV